MRIIRITLVLVVFTCLVSTVFGQRYSLYNSQTFPDVIENPTRPYFYDTCKSWATTLIFPQVGFDVAVLGDINKLIVGAVFSDTLRSNTIRNSKRTGNIIYSNFNLNLFSLKLLLNPKRQSEFLLNFGVRFESRINVKNDVLNLFLFGSGDYAGQTLNGALNMKTYARAYSEFNVGYRTNLNEWLSGGISLKYINGIVDQSINISDSYVEIEDKGRYIATGIKGSLNTSFDYDSETIGDDIYRNFINNKNSGFGVSFGADMKITESLSLTTNIKDMGLIFWNDESVTYTLDKETVYRGANAFSGPEVRDSIYTNLSNYSVDNREGKYHTNLNTRVDLQLQKHFGNRLSGTFIFAKPFFYPEADFAVLSDLRLTRKWHLLSNLVYNTSNYFALGGHLQFKGRWLEYYFGSEQLGNMIFHAQGLSQDVANQVVPVGFDYHVGIALKFGRCRNKPVTNQTLKDSDGDGVYDGLDKCPNTPGSIDRGGCPYQDTDGDGIIDFVDDCEKIPGVVEFGGCPIPDMDKDGVLDDVDDCPQIAGPKENKGCPIEDTDKDGIKDTEDKCPRLAGPISNNGCPYEDSDNDGVTDDKDKCPNVVGPQSNNGCPEEPKTADLSKEEKKAVDEAFENLVFKTGGTTIDPYSIPSLVKLANVLSNRPEIMLIVEGYTDNVGSAAGNKRLSQRRADAVKKFFVEKGINPERLTAVGYGEEKPIADNGTAFGRSVNRRVEFKLIQ